MTAVIFILLIGLAAANGANDVSKGVATLAGAGVARYRTAILWGAATTLLGALLSIPLGRGMGKLFSSGIVSASPTTAFALAVLVGTVAWVALASVARLPVSTTHAIVGSLVGAGLLLSSDAVQWDGVLQKTLMPLLISIVVAYVLSLVLTVLATWGSRVAARRRAAGTVAGDQPARPTGNGGGIATRTHTETSSDPQHGSAADRLLTGLHWLSSGATSAARGLNDTPKIAAIGGFALLPAGFTANQLALLVAAAMAVGSLLGIRVAHTLGEKVVKMSHGEGLRANLTTAVLVGAGATLALPMSTTHVSTGAIVGSAGGDVRRINARTLRDFLIAWTVTPLFTAAVAAVVFLIAR
jgi:PiT family inorganic phosphate transporter